MILISGCPDRFWKLDLLMKLADARLDKFEGELRETFLNPESTKSSVPRKRALRFQCQVQVSTETKPGEGVKKTVDAVFGISQAVNTFLDPPGNGTLKEDNPGTGAPSAGAPGTKGPKAGAPGVEAPGAEPGKEDISKAVIGQESGSTTANGTPDAYQEDVSKAEIPKIKHLNWGAPMPETPKAEPPREDSGTVGVLESTTNGVRESLRNAVKTGLSTILGNTSAGESYGKQFFACVKHNAIIRVDMYTYKYKFSTETLVGDHQNIFAYLFCTSVVDHEDLSVDELVYLASELAGNGAESKDFQEYLNSLRDAWENLKDLGSKAGATAPDSPAKTVNKPAPDPPVQVQRSSTSQPTIHSVNPLLEVATIKRV